MPEPDFDQIARDVVVTATADPTTPHLDADWQAWVQELITQTLRQVWNARGAADIEAVKGADIAHKDPLDQRPDTDDIVRAIRSVDR